MTFELIVAAEYHADSSVRTLTRSIDVSPTATRSVADAERIQIESADMISYLRMFPQPVLRNENLHT